MRLHTIAGRPMVKRLAWKITGKLYIALKPKPQGSNNLSEAVARP
jgi:hypothetical protein